MRVTGFLSVDSGSTYSFVVVTCVKVKFNKIEMKKNEIRVKYSNYYHNKNDYS